MKTVITLAIGFLIGRQIYINYDKNEARKKESEVKDRLKQFLQDNGLDHKEASKQSDKIMDVG
ncbi:MAG: hypothetical protein JKY51_01795 [Opitutaceae bacterium]|nr:hypothetical protein [Opitutaceae bacterium]